MDTTRQEPVGGRVLIPATAIRAKVVTLAHRLRAACAGEDLTVLVVLDGALLFAADLVRALDMPLRVETIAARSYRAAATRPGLLTLRLECAERLHGRHVLVVEDILDTGRTLSAILEAVSRAGPASLRSVVLLDKPERRVVPVRADFVGFEIPDAFVVGYGMDHDGRFRNLPDIRVLDERAESSTDAG
jgi:hypoxanthine phosphoribosyltransferase